MSDNSEGDRVLAALVTQYPDATVVTEDRDSGERLSGELPLIRLLQEERGLVVLAGGRPVRGSRKQPRRADPRP